MASSGACSPTTPACRPSAEKLWDPTGVYAEELRTPLVGQVAGGETGPAMALARLGPLLAGGHQDAVNGGGGQQ